MTTSSKPPARSTPAVEDGTSGAGGKKRVLVVDDNQDAAEILSEALLMMGYDTRCAHDGAAALAVATTFLPEVALLDIGLPIMDGYELALRLRALPGLHGMRLVALTGYGQDRDRARSVEAGFDEHLLKPIDLARVQQIVEGPGPKIVPG